VPADDLLVREVQSSEGEWLETTLRERWPHELLVGRGRVREPSELLALVAIRDDERIGLLTYVIEEDVAELVTLDALRPGSGIGARLIGGLASSARNAGTRALRVMVTNDNVRGLRYYQRLGFHLTALRVGAIERLRPHRDWIPRTGQDDIPIRDEIELELDL
jgi:ribosomal protein S18 acetylase RimI-like enzyme